MQNDLFDRDLSWLTFNERVLSEASKADVPALERLKFLSIYSSNLDEFYRVRIPALMALHKINKEQKNDMILAQIKSVIDRQLTFFGKVLREEIIPLLCENKVILVYDQSLPSEITTQVSEYFFTQIAAFIQPVYLSRSSGFFPKNNMLYFAVYLVRNGKEEIVVVKIPSDALPRFYAVSVAGRKYILFLDDIVREHLQFVFPHAILQACHSFKITRDADLNLQDEYAGDIAEKIERQITKRDAGIATRFLYDSDMEVTQLQSLLSALQMLHANKVEGGRYHNLKDLGKIPVENPQMSYLPWLPVIYNGGTSLFQRMEKGDFILHPPYHSYDTVLRFFNESALDEAVSGIFITLYRIANDSRIAQALISAARNGKSVTVFVELMARFDEANNLRWAKKMKAAGIKIIYSIPGLKVHAKVALVIRKQGRRSVYYGLMATGNFNEITARFYTDHVLFTMDKEMLRELELLFIFLSKRKKPDQRTAINFQHLMVAQFNLLERLVMLIEYEIGQATLGKPAAITLKLNNLEEVSLINKLYAASNAGVRIKLIIRGICTLIPGVKGMSELITIRRIVDRYLEHGRILIFHHGGEEKIFLGSADWMERNIYRRIEVCFPVYDPGIQAQLKEMIQWQLSDNTQAVSIDRLGQNEPVSCTGEAIASQYKIYQKIKHDA